MAIPDLRFEMWRNRVAVCTRAIDSAERWAYGEQLKRKPEKW